MAPDNAWRPVGIVLVGCGRMGQEHLKALGGESAVRLVAVVDPALEPSDRLPLKPLDEALSAPETEAVLIATPTATHGELVRAALARGLHVLCEKPLTLDPEADLALGRVAQEAGCILQIGFWRRFAAPYRAMRADLRNGAIGSPRAMRLAQWDARLPPLAFCDPSVSGGLEVDCGVHEFDVARWLLGTEVGAVQALAPAPGGELAEVGDVDTAVGLVSMANGVPLTIDLARTAGGTDSIRTEVVGSAGALVLEIAGPGRLTLRTSGGVHEREFPGDVIAAALNAQLAAFAAAVRAGQSDRDGACAADARAALMAARAMQAARSAAPARSDAQV